MIEQQARVTRTDGHTAWISVGGQSGCPACDAGKGCGAGVFGKLLKRRPVELALPNGIEARVGQAVNLGMPEALFLKLVFRLYGWPLLAGLAGAAICHQIGVKYLERLGMIDFLTLLGMFAGAALTLVAVRRHGLAVPDGGVRLLGDKPGGSCATADAARTE